MAIIGKLRERSGIIIGAIAVSILGFLIMDATNNQFGVLKGRQTNVGAIDGEKVDYNEFMKKYEDNQKNAEEQMRGRGGLTDEQRNYIRQQTWDDYVNTILMGKAYDKSGVAVTDDEMVELTTGANAHPYIRQSFTNPQTQQFEPQFVKMFIQNLDNDDKGTEPGTKRKQWNNLEKEIKKNQLTQKYAALVAKGLNTPSWMAERTYEDANRSADFKYLALPYSDLNEADIKYTDNDLNNYLKAHPARFEQKEETRKIQFAAFDIVASSADSAAVLKSLAEKLEEFTKGTKSTDDSVFVRVYSETPFDNSYFKKEQLAGSPIADSLFNLPVKSVIGPFVDGGQYKYAKIVNRKLLSDSVRVRDISFSFDNVKSQEEAMVKRKLFDSVFTQIDSFKQDFGQMAAMFSDDQQTKVLGGDKGWVKFGQMDKPYNDAIFFHASKGEVIKTVAGNSLHIVQVIDDRPTTAGVEVAYYSKSILPSPETERAIYAAASKFASDHSTEAKFKEAAKTNTAIKTVEAVKKDDFSVFGINNARDLVRWVFNAKKGDVSGIIAADKKHLVAYIDGIRAKGTPELDGVKEQVKAFYVKDKKAELLAKKITDAKASSIEELASKLGKQPGFAEKATFANPVLSGSGYEPNVVAAGVYAKQNKMTAPIEGNAGVYVLEKVAGVDPPKATDLSMYKAQLRQQTSGKASRGVFEAFKKLAKIEDNRFDFF
jgi:peptidyl-prolyl cis-trans isomerase D